MVFTTDLRGLREPLRCFHIVEFYNSHHPDPDDPDMAEQMDEQFPDGMFRFEKVMR